MSSKKCTIWKKTGFPGARREVNKEGGEEKAAGRGRQCTTPSAWKDRILAVVRLHAGFSHVERRGDGTDWASEAAQTVVVSSPGPASRAREQPPALLPLTTGELAPGGVDGAHIDRAPVDLNPAATAAFQAPFVGRQPDSGHYACFTVPCPPFPAKARGTESASRADPQKGGFSRERPRQHSRSLLSFSSSGEYKIRRGEKCKTHWPFDLFKGLTIHFFEHLNIFL